MEHDYARGATSVYHWTCSSEPYLTSRRCWQALPDIDAKTYAPISFISNRTGSAVASNYSKDDRNVYFNHAKLAGAEPKSFKVLGTNWAATPQGVHYAGELRADIDVASLEILYYNWARDKNAVYYSGAKVKQADPASLQVLSASYAVDRSHAFHQSEVLISSKGRASVSSFEVLGDSGYAKDGRAVFHQGHEIRGADGASFALLASQPDDCYAKDRNRIYYCGKAVRLGDVESFVVLDSFFAIDNDRVYFSGAAIEAADRDTFRPFEPVDTPPQAARANAEDKHNWYEVESVSRNLIVIPKSAP